MAYEYNDYEAGVDPMDEEERRRREQEAIANRMDMEAGANTSIAPVAPNNVLGSIKQTAQDIRTGARAATAPVRQAVQSAVGSVLPAGYASSIQRQESGNNPTIGYHDQTKSTAAGPYGLTAGSWADARKANPNLPEDITQATPEQHAQALNSFTQQNAAQLEKLGVPVNANTLSAAHFAGATGLHNFMNKKDEQGRPYISPEAQKANGGYDKAAAIIQGRLGGQATPASGATQPATQPAAQPQEQPQAPPEQAVSPYSLSTGQSGLGLRAPAGAVAQPETTISAQQRFQDTQHDLNGLLSLSNDKSVPEYLRTRARDHAYEMLSAEQKQRKADARINKLMESNDTVGLGKVMTAKSDEGGIGDWAKMILLRKISPEASQAAAERLGLAPGKWTTTTITDADGNEKQVEVQVSHSGKIMGGTDFEGNKLSQDELGQAATGIGTDMKTLRTQAQHAGIMEGNRMRAENNEARKKGIDLPYTDDQIAQRERTVFQQGMRLNRPVGAPIQQGGTASTQTTGGSATETAPAGSDVFSTWNKRQAGEDAHAAGKRISLGLDAIKSAGEALANGTATINDFKGRGDAFSSYAQQYARKISPGFNSNDTKLQNATRADFVKGDPGKMIRAHVLSANAFDEVEKAQEALNHGGMPAFNKYKDAYEKNTGNVLPVKAEAGALILSNEVMKSILPGGGALADRMESQHLFDTKLSPQQFKGAMEMIKNFQGDALVGLQNQWVSGGLPKDEFKERMLNSSPAARDLLDQANKKAGNNKPAGLPPASAVEAEMRRRGFLK